MFLGIDIGAGKIRIGKVRKGKVIEVYEEKTEKENIPNQVISLINKFDISKIKAVGIGIAGQIKNGLVTKSPNIPIKNLMLGKTLRKKCDIPFFIENDSNCQTIGEYKYGAGRGAKNIIGIFVGTGIGGGIIINERLIPCSEIGHMVIDIEGERCGCKRLGCFEALASGIALKRYAKEAGFKEGSASYIAKERENGNEKARNIIKKCGNLIGIGTTNLINILNPEVVILGGGVIAALPELIEIAKEVVEKEALFRCEILKASLGKDSGIIGASQMAENLFGIKNS